MLPGPSSESCYAHTVAAILESTYLIQLGGDAATLSLSRQQVLSCANKDDSPYWSAQCAGGDISEVRVCGGVRAVRRRRRNRC